MPQTTINRPAAGSISFGSMRTPTIQNVLALTTGIMSLPRQQREGIVALGNLINNLPTATRRKRNGNGRRRKSRKQSSTTE